MDIVRIDSYRDGRFSQTVLDQHGAYLVDGEPYEIEVIGSAAAVVRGEDRDAFPALVDSFRFHAPQIVLFYDEDGAALAEYPAPVLLDVALDRIQPSQFYIDEEKLGAVSTFVRTAEDIVIQVLPLEDGFISLDGHTRLYLAAQRGYRSVRAVVSETDDWVWTFVREAQRRNIFRPADMILLPHERYRVEWDQYCDKVFARGENMNEQYLTLRENPGLEGAAAAWFHDKWGVPEEAYLACMDAYLSGETEYGWYLCLDGERIVGGLGVIENDFHDRKDLAPNICAVYTEEDHRGRGIAGRLLNMAVEDLRTRGISPAYLVTDHTGFYERYGWEFLCLVQGDGEPEPTRMYIHR